MENRGTGGTGNADMAIKIILKKPRQHLILKNYLSILAKLKNRKTKLKTKKHINSIHVVKHE